MHMIWYFFNESYAIFILFYFFFINFIKFGKKSSVICMRLKKNIYFCPR